ncbi:S1C family serine protease [Corynebacterium sp.]|uniref:S1C family serine protease n=1 Tax=Corynebacterium sp. TaxID=1720 RepID=UPI0026DCEB3A|nr:trypsin-like peptidase domain-containing protein [Corynebacterium sp.]MDO4610328.1 trypsin-like peptidase domain-containing protein [Corynebacterium sp.]
MTGHDGFRRPEGVAGGVDPRTRGPVPDRDVVAGVPAGPDDRTAAAFAPGPGDAPGGLQPYPGMASGPAAGDGRGDVRDPSSRDYDPWADPGSRAVAGAPAAVREPEPPAEKPALPRVDVREAVFGRVIPWRYLALGAAAVLALAGVGGYVGGRLGGWDLSSGRQVELVREPGAAAPTAIGEVADRVQPIVVSIQVGDPFGQGPGGTGSGFVIDDRGHILTNNHVISAAANDPAVPVRVRFGTAGEPRMVPARIVGRDTMTDLAVLKVNDVAGLSVAVLGDSSTVRVGDQVIAMGSPLGLDRTVTAGIVSAVNRPVRLSGGGADTDGAADAIQTDASINPGNSGGPLVDARGAVVGITTSIYTTSGGSQGIGFAVPVNTAVDVAEQLILEGRARHPGIGATAATATSGDVIGARLATIVPGGPADASGLREGDVVVGLGGRPVRSSDELMVAVWSAGADAPIDVHLIRDGQPLTVPVTPVLG